MDVWTEKYRPQKLDEIIGQESITEKLQNFVAKKELPHLMFSGPAGCGKTTSAVCVAKELYGDAWRSNYLELNASDERGINVIREKVKNFARIKPLNHEFKIICLDEADALTTDAQQALRRTMENYSSITRFILICNYSSRILEPIQSRCAVFRYRPLDEKALKDHITDIAKKEGVKITEDGVDAIITSATGDVRKCINLLQASSMAKSNVTEKVVYDIASKANPKEVSDMVGFALKGKFTKSREKLLDLLITKGISAEEIIKEIHKQVFELDITDAKKISLIDRIGEYDFRIGEGANPQIQLEALLAQFALK